jgi:hypothetical protein
LAFAVTQSRPDSASDANRGRFTEYFEKEVLRKRPYIKKEWCTRVLDKPLTSEPQENNRYRFWDHFSDRRFKP